jgi:hypothetical protein
VHARIATFEIPAHMPREDGERLVEAVRARITGDGGPEGADRVLILADPDNGRGLNITFFDSAEHMQAAESFFEDMKPVQVEGVDSGRRIDVAHYEVMMDQDVG